MNDKEIQIDIQSLKKHREFYALTTELEAFCNKLDSMEDIDLNDRSRVTLAEEVAGRLWASKKIRDFLLTLGLVDKTNIKINKTFE